jgi:hypothetical protein
MARSRFATVTEKSEKRELGRTSVNQTPLAIRSRIELPDGFKGAIRERLSSKLGYAATLIERGTVRFEDINGPRGGIDTVCSIKLVLSGRPSVLVDARAQGPREAFTRATAKVATRLQHTKDRHELTTPEAPPRDGAGKPTRRPRVAADRGDGADAGEVIGRRAGRGAAARASALARPEKARRDAYVDTSAPGVSETDRKAGDNISARRNSRARAPRATVALEDSRTTPSRKSTRGSSNRGKPSQGKERTAVARSVTPSARASRASASRGRAG